MGRAQEHGRRRVGDARPRGRRRRPSATTARPSSAIDAAGVARRVDAAEQHRRRAVRHVDDLQARQAVGDIDEVAPHREVGGGPRACPACRRSRVGRIADVDHLQPARAVRHVGEVALHPDVVGVARRVDRPTGTGACEVGDVDDVQAGRAGGHVGVVAAHVHAVGEARERTGTRGRSARSSRPGPATVSEQRADWHRDGRGPVLAGEDHAVLGPEARRR